ncbi:sigma-70 family RNA polymerase sigma factor [Candidatus Poribacteria bacterium]|nr:sigma-70 family RNA polymerase sigma factor [Candidatus Poribacteria bacterium]
MIPDDVLVHKTIEGDVEAFNELVSRHNARIYGLSVKMLGNVEDAEDATQETFMQAYKSIHTFRFQSKFGTWLYQVAVNTCKQHLRKAKNQEKFVQNYTEEAVIHGMTDKRQIPERQVVKTEQQAQVHAAIDLLPPKQREVVTLHYLHHLKYKEIAEILNCSVGTVGSRLNLAMKNLKRKLSRFQY